MSLTTLIFVLRSEEVWRVVTLKSSVIIRVKEYGEVMFSKLRMGADDAIAPRAT